MTQWTIVADSGCDLIPGKLAENITFRRVPLTLHFGTQEWVDTPELDGNALLTAMEAYKGKSSSACPPPETWQQEFSVEGNVIALTITGGLSGSFNSAVCARDMVWEQNPDKPIFVLDTRSAGAEMALMVEKLVELIGQGLNFGEVVEGLKEYQAHTHLVFMLEHVDNFVKNGRLNKILGTTIGVLGIRIVGCASEQGTLQPLNKMRSLQKGYAALMSELEARGYKGGKTAITHVDNEAGAQELVKAMKEKWPTSTCKLLPASGLCTYYGERHGLLLGFEDIG